MVPAHVARAAKITGRPLISVVSEQMPWCPMVNFCGALRFADLTRDHVGEIADRDCTGLELLFRFSENATKVAMLAAPFCGILKRSAQRPPSPVAPVAVPWVNSLIARVGGNADLHLRVAFGAIPYFHLACPRGPQPKAAPVRGCGLRTCGPRRKPPFKNGSAAIFHADLADPPRKTAKTADLCGVRSPHSIFCVPADPRFCVVCQSTVLRTRKHQSAHPLHSSFLIQLEPLPRFSRTYVSRHAPMIRGAASTSVSSLSTVR